MLKLARPLRRMCIVAGLVFMSMAAQAFIFDGQITIDRALNSPTLTIRYADAHAAMVEMRVNGESVATRTVNPGKNAGETTFNLNLASLFSGDNRVEIRLYDKSGQLLASQTTTITTETDKGAVFVSAPKMGATVQGNVDIKIGFQQKFKNSYVSFFIDNQFKSLSNVPPFEFTWDTTKDSNGWHEVEAWVVDDSSSTFKTKKVRVFVQNQGGRTPREVATPKPTLVKPIVPATVKSTTSTAGATKSTLKPEPTAVVVKPVAAPTVVAIEAGANAPRLSVGGSLNSKPAELQASTAMGLKEMIPTGRRMAQHPIAAQVKNHLPQAALNAAASTSMTSITSGQRLPNIGAFAIVYNSQFVNFDVQPRVVNGIPLAPFRHLIEKAGGKVEWSNAKKNVTAKADGHDIFLHIGDDFALINKQKVGLDYASFIEAGRTIVPLSFMSQALNVAIEFDKSTGHVLITSVNK